MNIAILSVLFIQATNQYNLPPGLLSAVCYVESHHNIKAVHKDDGNGDSLGICEIKLNTAKLLHFPGSEKNLMNPVVNIKYAAKYLRKQLDRYHGDSRKAVAAYNAGSYRENRANKPINEKYIKKVFTAWAQNQ